MLATERSISLITPQESSLFLSDKVTHFAQPCQQEKGQLGTCYPRHHYSPFLWSTTASLSKNLRTWKYIWLLNIIAATGTWCSPSRRQSMSLQYIVPLPEHPTFESTQLLARTRTSVCYSTSLFFWVEFHKKSNSETSFWNPADNGHPKSPQPTLSFKLPMITWFSIELVISKKGFWIEQVGEFSWTVPNS